MEMYTTDGGVSANMQKLMDHGCDAEVWRCSTLVSQLIMTHFIRMEDPDEWAEASESGYSKYMEVVTTLRDILEANPVICELLDTIWTLLPEVAAHINATGFQLLVINLVYVHSSFIIGFIKYLSVTLQNDWPSALDVKAKYHAVQTAITTYLGAVQNLPLDGGHWHEIWSAGDDVGRCLIDHFLLHEDQRDERWTAEHIRNPTKYLNRNLQNLRDLVAGNTEVCDMLATLKATRPDIWSHVDGRSMQRIATCIRGEKLLQGCAAFLSQSLTGNWQDGRANPRAEVQRCIDTYVTTMFQMYGSQAPECISHWQLTPGPGASQSSSSAISSINSVSRGATPSRLSVGSHHSSPSPSPTLLSPSHLSPRNPAASSFPSSSIPSSSAMHMPSLSSSSSSSSSTMSLSSMLLHTPFPNDVPSPRHPPPSAIPHSRPFLSDGPSHRPRHTPTHPHTMLLSRPFASDGAGRRSIATSTPMLQTSAMPQASFMHVATSTPPSSILSSNTSPQLPIPHSMPLATSSPMVPAAKSPHAGPSRPRQLRGASKPMLASSFANSNSRVRQATVPSAAPATSFTSLAAAPGAASYDHHGHHIFESPPSVNPQLSRHNPGFVYSQVPPRKQVTPCSTRASSHDPVNTWSTALNQLSDPSALTDVPSQEAGGGAQSTMGICQAYQQAVCSAPLWPYTRHGSYGCQASQLMQQQEMAESWEPVGVASTFLARALC